MILPLSLDPHNWVSTIGTVWMLLVSNTSGSDSRAASMLQNLLCTSHHFTDYQLCVPTKGIKWQHHSTPFNMQFNMQCTHLSTRDVFGHDHCSRIRQNLCPTTSGRAISAMSNQSVTQTSTSFTSSTRYGLVLGN